MPKYRITIEVPYAGCPDIVEEFETDEVLTDKQLDAEVAECWANNFPAGAERID
ncbi:MAG TPA: hypothetical protein VGW74_09360 [Propionibacteriaceae bacterium]|nr:hypothetical protein [Propionibacteriaceae bacterium]